MAKENEENGTISGVTTNKVACFHVHPFSGENSPSLTNLPLEHMQNHNPASKEMVNESSKFQYSNCRSLGVVTIQNRQKLF
ncbi:hypothetical protein OIU79_004788 [Salix purpurea]|uniref:Uncharacterized protein n=1 Tax=Salix purpurea TaxID=77065 RepID=A0A9Q0UB43_SALPP|nr:hypothetical protein OIU79_004788 [Salix purpurea]